jgi:hypothetical protein
MKKERQNLKNQNDTVLVVTKDFNPRFQSHNQSKKETARNGGDLTGSSNE